MARNIQQYQVQAGPPLGLDNISRFESAFHEPWREPVRFKIDPRRRIALIASGSFAPVLNPETQLTQFFESRWHQPWSEPKRFRRGAHPSLVPFGSTFFDNTPAPNNLIQGWYQEWRGPRWPKRGLKAHLQQATAIPPRYLPTANVTATMAAMETNNDIASFAITTYGNVTGVAVSVAVSISELPDTSGSASISET